MPEMRHDPVQKRWVIIASERGFRPTDYEWRKKRANQTDVAQMPEFDPFEEGHESSTPPEVYAVRTVGIQPDSPGWKVRVVPNKFPALMIEGNLDRAGNGLYDRMNGVGAHEVVIETPERDGDLALLEPDHAFEVVKAYRERLTDLMRDRRFRYVLVFRNHGEYAGSTLFHPHSQITALPVTPLTIARELESARQHFHDKERCIFCDLIAQELHDNVRIVAENDQFLAYTPYASRFPYEICLLPKKHQHDYRKATDSNLRGFVQLLQDVLQRMRSALKDPPYNMILHTAPNSDGFARRPSYWATLDHDWHWHLEIIPRLNNIAGFEWGTGLFINPVKPEQAAELLRGIELE